jgi:hypothetical protein
MYNQLSDWDLKVHLIALRRAIKNRPALKEFADATLVPRKTP